MKVTFYSTQSYDEESFNRAEHKGLTFKFFETRLTADTASLAKGSEAVCVFVNDDVSEEVVNKLYDVGVRVILLRCAGYNNVDVKACYGKIHVYRVPAYSPYAVAEHASALLLTSVRKIHKAFNRTREFNFSLNGLTGFDLHGKTVGVVGTGKIGRCFINIARGYGMNVLCYDPHPVTNSDYDYVELDELFKRSDVISLHCPLTRDTYHLIDDAALKKMKKGVIIINTSRGGLINSTSLLTGLKERIIGAACLDVYEEEADIFYNDFSEHIMDNDTLSLLISLPNVIVTSHQAFLTVDALKNIADTTVSNYRSHIKNDGLCQSNEICYKCTDENMEKCKRERNGKCF